MSCPTISFDMGQDVYDKLLASAHASGIMFEGDVARAKDCTFDWRYLGGTLFITCTSKPFVVGCGTVNEDISKIVNQAIANAKGGL